MRFHPFWIGPIQICQDSHAFFLSFSEDRFGFFESLMTKNSICCFFSKPWDTHEFLPIYTKDLFSRSAVTNKLFDIFISKARHQCEGKHFENHSGH